jgi:hypothetical protein
MKLIKDVLKKLFGKQEVNPLGRWKITYCNTSLARKVDLSNEDHCGPYGQYNATKLDSKNIKIVDKK